MAKRTGGRKVLAALAVSTSFGVGSLATSAAASAAPWPNCSSAPTVLTWLEAEQTAVETQITALQSAESQETGAGHSFWAFMMQGRVAVLEQVESSLAAAISALSARCSVSGGSTGESTLPNGTTLVS